jgi:hypothetical protein
VSVLPTLSAQPINLKNGFVIVAPSVSAPMRETAARMLTEEIVRRTSLTLKTTTAWPKSIGMTPIKVLYL